MQDIFIWVDSNRSIQYPIQANIYIRTTGYTDTINTLNKFDLNNNIIISFSKEFNDGKTGLDLAQYIVNNKLPHFKYMFHEQNCEDIDALLSENGYEQLTNY